MKVGTMQRHYTPRRHIGLKLFVYAMGATLMFAAVFITYLLYKRNEHYFTGYSPSHHTTSEAKMQLPIGHTAELSLDSEVIGISSEGGLLYLTTKPRGTKQNIVIFDYRTNSIVGTIYVNVAEHVQ
jgi:hypothetical protein